MTSRSIPSELYGLVLLDKPGGITSFNALNALKKKTGCRKVGHAGTLDKFAEGLLITLIGTYTKLAPYFVEMDKVYETTIRFGQETDTLDPEGEVVAEAPVPAFTAIEKALPRFIGTIQQIPPRYSAIHVSGRRAHRLAREGQQFAMKPRSVTVYDISNISFDAPHLTITVRCSKGTYIRSLARDIAHAAGSCAYVSALKRSRIGPHSLENAVCPDQFDPGRDIVKDRDVFQQLAFINCLAMNAQSVPSVVRGVPVEDAFLQQPPENDGLYALFSPDDSFLALVERTQGRYSYKFVRAAG